MLDEHFNIHFLALKLALILRDNRQTNAPLLWSHFTSMTSVRAASSTKRHISSVDVNSFFNRTKLERKNTFHFPLSKHLFQERFPSKWPTQLMHMQIFQKNSLEIKSYLLIPVFLHRKILGKPYFNITSNNKKVRQITQTVYSELLKFTDKKKVSENVTCTTTTEELLYILMDCLFQFTNSHSICLAQIKGVLHQRTIVKIGTSLKFNSKKLHKGSTLF